MNTCLNIACHHQLQISVNPTLSNFNRGRGNFYYLLSVSHLFAFTKPKIANIGDLRLWLIEINYGFELRVKIKVSKLNTGHDGITVTCGTFTLFRFHLDSIYFIFFSFDTDVNSERLNCSVFNSYNAQLIMLNSKLMPRVRTNWTLSY